MDKLKQYLDLLPQCMLNYQFIEEGLRFCLYRQHGIVGMRVKTILPYKPPIHSIQNAAMGKLISYFQTFCDNEGLLKSLNEVKKKRDHLAHQGYLHSKNKTTPILFPINSLSLSQHMRRQKPVFHLFKLKWNVSTILQKLQRRRKCK